MNVQKIKLIAACAMALTLSTASAAASAERPAVTLRVLNEAHVPINTLLETQKEAARILSFSGIDLVWLTCGADSGNWTSGKPCSTALKPNEFWLHVTTQKPSAAPQDPLGFTNFHMGSERGEAGVYYPAALKMAERSRTNLFQILAAATVHEVGHLILGPKSHSPLGVMCPGFGDEQLLMISQRWLRFTPDQAKHVQSEVRRRASEWDYGTH